VGITNVFYIKLKSGSDIDVLYTFAEEHNATVICEDFLPLWNALSCSSRSADNALELANIILDISKINKQWKNIIYIWFRNTQKLYI